MAAHALAWALLLATPVAQAMDLLQAWQAAMASDPQILGARATRQSRLEREAQANALLRPNVSASVSRSSNYLLSDQADLFGNPVHTGQGYFSDNQTLSVRQPLYRPALTAQQRQSQQLTRDAEAQWEHEVQALAVRVTSAYFDVAAAVQQLELVRAQVLSFQTQLEAAQKALAAGSGTRTDIDDARAKLDMARAQALEATQNQAYALQQLQALVNQPVQAVAALDARRMDEPSLALTPLAEWLDQLEARSPDLKALKAQRDAALHDLDRLRAGHLPSVDVVAQRVRSGSENLTRVQSSFDNTSVGVQLSVPLYAGGGIDSTVRQATAELERAEQALEAGRRELGLRVHKEHRGVTEGWARVVALQQAQSSAALALQSSKRSYEAGVRTRLDILNAELQLLAVRRDLAMARYTCVLSLVRLHALLGLVDEDKLRTWNQWFVPAVP